jgi:hypothetical protein
VWFFVFPLHSFAILHTANFRFIIQIKEETAEISVVKPLDVLSNLLIPCEGEGGNKETFTDPQAEDNPKYIVLFESIH